MPVIHTLIVSGRSVLRMFGSAETSGSGVPDGTVRLYNDGTHSYLQVYSLATGAWTTLTPEAALVIENLTTAGASGTVPTSNGSGGLTMVEPSAGAWEEIATQTLGSDAAAITFATGLSGYRRFRLTVMGQASANSQVTLRINNDSGSNYTWQLLTVGGTSTFGTGDSSADVSGNTGIDGHFVIEATVVKRASSAEGVAFSHGYGVNMTPIVGGFLWDNTSDAISRIDALLNSGNYRSGTVAILEGSAL